MRVKLFAFLACSAIALPAFAIDLTEVFISGVAGPERDYVESLLPMAEGDSFASLGDLVRKAALAEAYLRQDEGFAGASIEIEEISESEAAAYVLMRGAAMGGLTVFGLDAMAIPHFPVYATGFAFVVGAYEQLLGIDLPFSPRLRLDALSGHAQTTGGVHAISGKAGLSLKALPLLSFYLPVELDAYPATGDAWPLDLALRVGGKLDLSYLESVYLVGGSLEASARKGFLDYDYLSWQVAAALSFRPVSFLSLGSSASLYSLSGAAPPLRAVGEFRGRNLRVPPAASVAARGIASASAVGRLIAPFKLELGVLSLSPAAYGFFEASRPYDALADICRGAYSCAAGGGIMIDFSPPFSLTVEVGYGYSISEGRPAWIFNVEL